MDVFSFILHNTNFKTLVLSSSIKREVLKNEYFTMKGREKKTNVVTFHNDIKSVKLLNTRCALFIIHRIVELGLDKMLKVLLKEKILDPSIDICFIDAAVFRNRSEIVRLLLANKRVRITRMDDILISVASHRGYTEIVRLLLADKRVDPTFYDNHAIKLASDRGHVEIVRMLLADKRVDPSAENNQAIQNASKNGHTAVVKLLLTDERVKKLDFKI
jgi:hypothetical protein